MTASSKLMELLEASIQSPEMAKNLCHLLENESPSSEHFNEMLLTYQIATCFDVQQYDIDKLTIIQKKLQSLYHKTVKNKLNGSNLSHILNVTFVFICLHYITEGYSLTEEILNDLNYINSQYS